jgi:hypothetical protein
MCDWARSIGSGSEISSCRRLDLEMEFKSGEIQDSSYPASMTLLRLRIMVIRLRGLIRAS